MPQINSIKKRTYIKKVNGLFGNMNNASKQEKDFHPQVHFNSELTA